uniref:Uncharacterized protein n=1 Tax=Arundo donax TaxID=35708 RepID=A0A0A9FQY0_ARUDO
MSTFRSSKRGYANIATFFSRQRINPYQAR